MTEAAPARPARVPAPAGVDYPGKTLGIVAIVLAVVVGGIVGLILGLVANSQSKAAGYTNTPAKVAIIIGIVVLVIWVVVVVVIAIAAAAAVNAGLTVPTY